MDADLWSEARGDFIASGYYRDVFEYRLGTGYVLKVEHRPGTFQNVAEWLVWDRVQDADVARWLAPCENISGCGRYLTMVRTIPLRPRDKLPAQLPIFLADVQRSNFGWLDGRIVCHDYGILRWELPQRLRRVKWE